MTALASAQAECTDQKNKFVDFDTASYPSDWARAGRFPKAHADGRPVYGIGGLGGRIGEQETTSGDWTGQTDGKHNLFAKVRGAGSHPVVRSK